MKIAKHQSRLVVLVLVASMLLQLMGSVVAFADEPTSTESVVIDDSRTENSLDAMEDLMVSTTYAEYLEAARKDGIPDADCEPIVVNALDYVTAEEVGEDPADYALVEKWANPDSEDEVKEVLYTPDVGKVTYKVTVPKTALYTMKVEYYPCEGHGSNIERILLIDREVPFKEARYLTFSRVWQDKNNNDYNYGNRVYRGTDAALENPVFRVDVNGNEMRPSKEEKPRWIETEICDSETFYNEPLKFLLTEGEHLITFEAACEPMLMKSFTFQPADVLPTYEEYLASHADASVPEKNDKNTIMIHAETPYQTSEQVIYAMNDRTSGITVPQDPAAALLNTIGGNGGDKWKIAGQWISYEFDIEEAGFYDVVPRFKQTINQGLFSSRSLKIDGEYPFAEAKKLQFKYGDDWQVAPLNDGTTNFKFYFEEGHHTIEFKAVLGDMADILNRIEISQTSLNDYYRQILMITGSEPDEYTDYEFAKLIPGVLSGMRQEKANLEQVSGELEAKIGSKGQNTVLLSRIAFLLGEMGNDQDKIASNLSNYKSYIGSLGTWLLSTKAQPLQLDYIMIQPSGSSLPKENASFFEAMGHEFGSFFMSFFTDYNSLGASEKIEEDDPNSIEVWITTGRDQATIMRQMVDDSFNDDTVSVNLKLIAAGTLLPATLAGVGPDVSMDGDPVGFGIRNAVIPLNYFNEEVSAKINDSLPEEASKVYSFEEIKQSCFKGNEELFVPLTVLDPDRIEYADGSKADQHDAQKEYKVVNGDARDGVVTYGLPSTLDFPMLFYRKDIFVDLGLDVPETWDDVEGVIRALSENQMEMGFSQALTQIYMYQSGLEWFKSAEDYEPGMKEAIGNKAENRLDNREYMRTVGIASNLDSNGALDAFQRMTEWFTLYGEPVAYDFANRFRTGEMPIAISNYTTYNQLRVFAPEIAGLWEFVQLPGVEREDGTINHASPAAPHAMMMMKDAADDITSDQDVTESKKAQNAWRYLQWWVSYDTQTRFGQEQVAIMGTAAKYNTANIDALTSQSWTAQEKRNLEQQFRSLKGTPMSPGNYIVARYTNFAFYAVVDDGEVASEAMLGYVDDINHELSRKRDEYGFLTMEEYMEELKEKGIEA